MARPNSPKRTIIAGFGKYIRFRGISKTGTYIVLKQGNNCVKCDFAILSKG